MARIEYNSWAEELYVPHSQSPYDYMLVDGGRGSSKSFECARALIVRGHMESLRVAVARERLNSIAESCKVELEERIAELGLARPDCYRAGKMAIDHANGTHIFFVGLSKVTEAAIKGLSNVDLVWIDEADPVSHSSWEKLGPTIRKVGSQIWATWNNRYRTDAVVEFLEEARGDPRVWHRHLTWRDNAFFTAKNDRDRRRDQERKPERYEHVWEGDFDDLSAARKVIPYALLRKCVEAWPRRPKRGAFVEAGLDVADTGNDDNALALRCGPELFHCETWHGSKGWTVSHTARHAKAVADRFGATRFRYDAGGPGAGIRGPLLEAHPKFSVEGCQFGGKVQGEDRIYIRGRNPKTNGEYFFNWAGQAGWAVRIRAEYTQRLIEGEEGIDSHRCLFIDPRLPELKDTLKQMAQPEWSDDTGKLKIDKQPHEAGEAEPPSPDRYDGVILAYAGDARLGLRQPY